MNNLCQIVFICLICMGHVSLGFSITVSDLMSVMDANESFVLIDIRDNHSFQQSHIPGAINIPFQLIKTKKMPALGKVIVYGDGIDASQPLEVSTILSQVSGIYPDVLEGGFLNWCAKTLYTTQPKGLKREHFQHITYGMLKKAAKHNSNIVLMDLRKLAGRQSRSKKSVQTLSDLSILFPDIPVKTFDLNLLTENTKKRSTKTNNDKLYVLIDQGKGFSEIIARQLKSAGIRRFVILSGGELTLSTKGQSQVKQLSN